MELTKEILKYNTENQLFVENRDDSAKWFTYAQYYGHKHGMTDPVYLNAFSYFASIFIGGMGLSAGAEEFFKQSMEYDLVDYIGGFDFRYNTGEEKEKVLEKIFYFMENEAIKYEKVYVQCNACISSEEYEIIQKVEGKTIRDKVINLMLHPQNNNITKRSGKKELRWNLRYTESKLWDKLEGENDRIKLINLL